MKNTNPLSHIFSCLFQGFTGTVRCLCWWYLGQFLPCQSNRSALPFNQREHRFSSAFFYSYLYLDAQMTILMGDIETTWRESLSSSMGGPEFFSILTVTVYVSLRTEVLNVRFVIICSQMFSIIVFSFGQMVCCFWESHFTDFIAGHKITKQLRLR